jgi:exopolysaccharide biosynthesis polyprenyl glycosylphosphotransferase
VDEPQVREQGSDAGVTVRVGDLQAIHEPDLAAQTSLTSPPEAAARPSVADRYHAIGIGIAVSDAACIAVALAVSTMVWFGVRSFGFTDALMIVAASILWVALFGFCGLYSLQQLSPADEFRRILGATGLGTVLLIVGSFWGQVGYSRPWLALTCLIALIAELASHRLWRAHLGQLKASGELAFRTLILGTDADARSLAESLASNRFSGYQPVGHVRVGESRTDGPLPVLGDLSELDALVEANGIECLFVAATVADAATMSAVDQLGRQRDGLEVRVSAKVPYMLTSRLALQQIGSAIALSVKPARLTGTQAALKRTFDLTVALFACVLTLPIFGVVALAVRLSSPGPVLFRQARATKGGRAFTMLKFRTMRADGDRVLAELGIDPAQPFFKLADDPRITRVGRVLRATSLDELPQLLNIIRGDMSLVGPRPLPMDQVESNLDVLRPRTEVKAGLTGWWQINGRSDVSLDEALRMDLFYIENWSLSLDLYILAKTAGAVLAKGGAY